MLFSLSLRIPLVGAIAARLVVSCSAINSSRGRAITCCFFGIFWKEPTRKPAPTKLLIFSELITSAFTG
jgi:hypothetical protein